MFGVSYTQFPDLWCMRIEAGPQRSDQRRTYPLAVQVLRRLDGPVPPGHHPQGAAGQVPDVAARHRFAAAGRPERPIVPPGDGLVLAHRGTTTSPVDAVSGGGDPRRHLLPVLVPAGRHRRPPGHRLAVVRSREEDRLAADPAAPARAGDGSHRRRHRPARRPRRGLARHPHPTLLLPHLPERPPPPDDAATTTRRTGNTHADKRL